MHLAPLLTYHQENIRNMSVLMKKIFTTIRLLQLKGFLVN